MKKLRLPTPLLVVVVLVLGLVVSGWMLLPARAEGYCFPVSPKLGEALTAIIVASLVAMIAGFFAGLRYRSLALILSAILIVSAVLFGSFGVFFAGDETYPDIIESRLDCGRTQREAAAWGWLVALPITGIALSTAAGALRRPWGAIVATVAALSMCTVLIVILTT